MDRLIAILKTIGIIILGVICFCCFIYMLGKTIEDVTESASNYIDKQVDKIAQPDTIYVVIDTLSRESR